MPLSKETIAAIATPKGNGGIGVIRVSGTLAVEIYTKLTRAVPEPRKAAYVSFRSPDGELIDKGIGLYFKSPASYTGEDLVECHIHGSRIVLNMLLDEIFLLGARPALPGEFTERSFLNNKMDLVQAEAVADLIESHSNKAAHHAMRSLDGAFSTEINRLKEQVFKARALAEATLDFPDERDVLINIKSMVQIIKNALETVDNILLRAKAGRALEHKPSLVIIGPPNVGKSSIMNFLSGYDSAIVSSVPGTTRDIIKEHIFIEDNSFLLVDTAGLRQATDEIEKEGINRTNKAISQADLIIQVFAVDNNNTVYDESLVNNIVRDIPVLTVRNKADLYAGQALENSENMIHISAKTGYGMDVLIKKISQSLAMDVDDEDVIFARQRHIDALNLIRQHLVHSLESTDKEIGMEILAEILRQALGGFDEISGKTTTDDILGEVFSRFCIGK